MTLKILEDGNNMAIKINDKFSFEKSLHGFNLHTKYMAKRKDTGEEYEKYHTSFHSTLQQVAQKVLHEVSEGVEGDISDLISAYHYCTNTIVKELEDK